MKRVLVVDDEKDCVELVQEVLESEGYATMPARDGEAALKVAREDRPDLVVLDVQMPKKDGFTVFVELRQDEAMRDIPVIMLTGVGQKVGIRFSKRDMVEFFGEEPSAYIEKPLDPETLIAEVRKAIGPA